MLGIRHLALNVTDIKKMTQFYTEVMGMKIEWNPDEKNIYLTSGSDNFALHEVEGFQKSPSALDHFGFVVETPETVDEWAKKIQEAGIPLEKEVKTHRDNARSFYFRDPEENLIQLIYHPPISDKS